MAEAVNVSAVNNQSKLNEAPKNSSNYIKPSLPFILCDYGFKDPETERALQKKKEEKEKKREERKKRLKKKGFDNGYRDIEKEKEREKHFLHTVKDLYKLRDYYHDEYTTLLTEKVEKQRKERKEQDELRLEIEKKKEEKKKDHRLKKRLEKHILEDSPNLSVPKSDLYHIITLQDKLRREGKLKTSEEIMKFREEIKEPRVFYANFKIRKQTGSDYDPGISGFDQHVSYSDLSSWAGKTPSSQQNLDEEDAKEDSAQRALSRISESKEGSRPGTKGEPWAVTQQFSAINKSSRSRKQNRKSGGSMHRSKSDFLFDLEKRFPRLEMPQLHCFTMDLSEKPPDPEEVRLKQRLAAKEKYRKQMARIYTKMYQLAMTNSATATRIMDQHEDVDMEMLLNGPDLCDVIADHHWMNAYGLHEIEPHADSDNNPDEQPEEPAFMTEPPENLNSRKSSTQGSRKSSLKSSDKNHDTIKRNSGKSSKNSLDQTPKPEVLQLPPLSLTMEEVEQKCQIKESKALSTFWTNYMETGKEPTRNPIQRTVSS